MLDDREPRDGGEAENDEPSAFDAIVASIADEPVRSRRGFGAFRHYDSLLNATARLVFESGLFTWPESGPWAPWPIDPDFWFFHRRSGSPGHIQLFRSLLGSTQCYHPAAIWALFWAVAKAEHRFNERYVPFWSHEERLTGHLVSELIGRIEEFEPYWGGLAVVTPPTGRRPSSSGMLTWLPLAEKGKPDLT